MGKKRRLNKFISKWIKSDLPKERSAVLLLGVTRIPTSPVPARRPCSLPLNPPESNLRRRNSITNSRRSLVRRNSSKRRLHNDYPGDTVTHSPEKCPDSGETPDSLTPVTPTISVSYETSCGGTVMERSVDSIGTCSLDVEASADLSDWSEISSVGTLRSASITPIAEPHLPSYLSLACTVNGYSTTTNYDPERLARSRDASPHRLDSDHLTNKNLPTYSIQNNLLSPPNLVPLPTHKTTKKNMENTLAQRHHQEFYSSQKTMSYRSHESRFSSNIYSSDTIDACIENGHSTYQSKCVSFETKNITNINGQSNTTSTETVRKEISNGKEIKSFIQQRVERLYGPGALAQGFFVTTKRQKNRLSESENEKEKPDTGKHSKSMQDKLLLDDDLEPSMKQSASSPTLPVMRHLRPEFRAQLPTICPRKEVSMPKSITVPKLKDEVKVNGHSNNEVKIPPSVLKDSTNNDVTKQPNKQTVVKDGHYFLNVLDEQTKRLLNLADKTESELENPNLSEEIIGKIRSASGKARLLVSQKMQQFKGLCTNNINQSVGEAFPTTNEDLQGFWDMVMLQVNQVDALFDEIEVIKQNGWVEVKPTKTAINGNGTKARKAAVRPRPTANPANEEARKQREAERKKIIEERRRAMKAQQQSKQQSQNIEIFVPESS